MYFSLLVELNFLLSFNSFVRKKKIFLIASHVPTNLSLVKLFIETINCNNYDLNQ
jgi:hypothetical protein